MTNSLEIRLLTGEINDCKMINVWIENHKSINSLADPFQNANIPGIQVKPIRERVGNGGSKNR
jgi:hypothetical protein